MHFAKLTERELDTRIADKASTPGCNGGCDQGRKACDCRPAPAEACSDIGVEPAGQHRTSPLIRAWLVARRWLF